MYKTRITDLEQLSTTPLTNGCCNDDMIQLGSLISVLSRCFISFRSTMRILFIFSSNTRHTLQSTGFKSRKFGGYFNWGGINSGVSSCNNSMVARVLWAFQVSQGSVETSFRWGGKRSFCSKFIHETMYQISPESLEFYRRYYKTILVSFFLDTLDASFTNSQYSLMFFICANASKELAPTCKLM